MSVFAAPIKPGKLDEWRAFVRKLNYEHRDDLLRLNRRYGLERHRVWLQREPDGTWISLVEHSGPGGDRFLQKLAQSKETFDEWFKQQLREIHGIDLSRPPPEDLRPHLVLDA